MKKLILLACVLFLAGCAKQPVITNLKLRLSEQPGGVYASSISAGISGQDSRKSKDVVVYLSDEPPTGLANLSSPLGLIEEKLTEGLRSQGLRLDPFAPVQLKFDIKELLVKVSRPKMLYNAEGKTFLTLTVENRGSVFTKTYKREATQESATRPGLPKLEEMLNNQLTEIVQLMLQDEEVRNLIRKK